MSCCMYFQAIKEWVELVESLAVIAAAVVAIWIGLNWKRDFLSKRRLEVQEEVLTRMHELKDLLSWLHGSLRYVEHQTPEPAVGETTIALQLAAEDAAKHYQLIQAKLQDIAALEVKARLLFEPEMIDVFRIFTVARVMEFTKIQRLMGHVGVLVNLLEGRQEFDRQLVDIAGKVGEQVAKALDVTEAKPHSFEILAIEIDKFCAALALFRPFPRRVYEKSIFRSIRQRLKR